MPGNRRCSFWRRTAIAASPTTGAGMAGRASRGTATTWTPTPTTWRSCSTALDLKDAMMIGHSTGGGEVARYIGRHGTTRVAKAVLMGAVPPLMLKTAANPGGLPMEVFDGFRAAYLADRAQFFLDVASGPFFGFNRPGAKVSQGLIDSWWLQGMMAGHKNALRLHQGLLGNGLHRGPEEVRRADADHPRRRRPDRADRRLGDALGEARQERHAEDLPRRHRTAWATRARTSSTPTCSPLFATARPCRDDRPADPDQS